LSYIKARLLCSLLVSEFADFPD